MFSKAVLEFIREKNLKDLTVFGYSMGGYAALYAAIQNPVLFKKIITLGTKFHRDEMVAAKEIKMMDPETIAVKVPAFAASPEKLHTPNDWKEVLRKTASMLEQMGRRNPLQPDDYNKIITPCLVMLGDRDRMVSYEETAFARDNIP